MKNDTIHSVCFAFLLVTLSSLCSSVWADDVSVSGENKQETTQVRYWYRNFDTSHSYELLKLALRKTEDLYGKAEILRSEELTQGRAVALLKQSDNGFLDVINFVPDDDRVKSLIPIYIAGEEGLVGRRVCIIQRGNEAMFEGVRTLADLQELGVIVGQGTHWPDTQILKDNGVNVMTHVSYENLFSMLEKGRFHCYLRGAHEAIEDLLRHGSSQLVIEPKLLFVYPSASLFFVSKENVQLANRIELGLRRAILDGDYHHLFHYNYADDIQGLSLHSRRLIRLNNSLLSDEIISKSTRRTLRIDGKIDD